MRNGKNGALTFYLRCQYVHTPSRYAHSLCLNVILLHINFFVQDVEIVGFVINSDFFNVCRVCSDILRLNNHLHCYIAAQSEFCLCNYLEYKYELLKRLSISNKKLRFVWRNRNLARDGKLRSGNIRGRLRGHLRGRGVRIPE